MKIRSLIKCELARRSFWEYCKLVADDFYKESRVYLRDICDTMQDFYENDGQVLCINLPPRHGKSRTATLFVQWILGKDNSIKIMTGSYNETLSTTFSKQVRGAVQEQKADEDRVVYTDIFPNTKIKYGDGASNLWSLEGQNNANYLATSPGGTATGFGADIFLGDDIIKNAEEANNAMVLEKHWDWFRNTILSRLQGKRKIILIMTRWNSKDLCGMAIEHFKEIGVKVDILSMKACENNKMLCDEVLNKNQYDMLLSTLGQDIASANYQQEPIDLKGCLYETFQEYEELPQGIKSIDSYIDTADGGKDYLCSITYAVGRDKKAYILDVIYTKEDMSKTEKIVSDMLLSNKVNWCRIESNNGGRGFSRAVERISRGIGNNFTRFKPFHQSLNKQARILSNSTGVMNNIIFPKFWQYKFKDFHKDITTFQREGKNKHDDCADALTGVYEYLCKNSGNLSGLRL